MAELNLLPCSMPDCGSTLVGTGRLPCGVDTVCCGHCGLSVPATDEATAPERWNRRAAPPAAQLDADNLPLLPDTDVIYEDGKDQWGYVDHGSAYSAKAMQEYARQVVAPYAERIRLLERELEDWKKSSGLLAASRDRWKDSAKRCEQPAQSISSNEFRNLIEAHDRAADFGEMDAAYEAIVAYIDGRTAGTASDVWASATNSLPMHGETVLVMSESWSQPEVLKYQATPYQRFLNTREGKWYWYPERMHWMPLAAAPSTQEGAK